MVSTAKKNLADVVAWCNLRKIRVEFSTIDDGSYYKEEQLICINNTEPLTEQLYTLLHECGHALIADKSKTTEFRFRHGYGVTSRGIRKRFIHQCDIIEEEFEAWHRGRKLATKLGIKINDVTFSNFKANCLKTYIKSAASSI